MSRSVIVAGARTPIGKFRGAFASLQGIGSRCRGDPRRRSTRAQVGPDQVDYVVMGQVLRAGTGQITARQAAIAAGIPKEVPALNVDKVCLSGTTRDRARRPDDPGGRGRDRGGGRDGVDDERSLRAPGGARRLASGTHADDRHDDPRRAVVHLHTAAHGRVVRRRERGARDLAGGAGRVGGAFASAGRRRLGLRGARRGGRAGRGPAAPRRPGRRRTRRGHPPGLDPRDARTARAGVPRRRDHHRGQRVADQRRRRRGRPRERREGPRSSASSRSSRSSRMG